MIGPLWSSKQAQKATVLTVTLTSRGTQKSTLCGTMERKPECLNGFWSAWTDTPLQLLQRALLFGSFFSTSATKHLVWLCW